MEDEGSRDPGSRWAPGMLTGRDDPRLGPENIRAVKCGPALHLSLGDKPELMEAVFQGLYFWH